MNKQIALLALVVIGLGSAGSFVLWHQSSPEVVSKMDAILAKITPDELVKNSSGVVLGTVENLGVEKIPSSLRPGKDDIVTNATIRAEKYLFNPANLTEQEVTVQVIGGTIGDETMNAEESPSFKVGDRVIVFLNKKDDKTYTVYGWAQGKYTVDSNGMVGVGDERVYLKDVFGAENIDLATFGNQIASIAKTAGSGAAQ
jgi:hypothetical protein